MSRIVSRALIALLAVVAMGAHVRGDEAGQLYAKKIRPLLERKCYDCHSAKAEEVKGGLKLDTLEEMLKGGPNGPAIVPGDLENSFLLRAIRYEEADYQMPPAGKLSDEDIRAVEQWVRVLKDAK
ncbi:Planctomycete cytochrome C [Anatilimnocola aggregata]|uniref:Planctomycete cytochrome C n=1 Tax=Anatilimnocola aggregata TaxID=2528021 RepID=A0A517YMR8_9BACT|nr:c-type cytochrome domain-containing protein [Anatilimnocola aggregata]QDU31520.1 Planctomycete cytochrome C [Anatilimnocola aggregata]